jgi:GDP-L-fucose synthase
VFKKILVTGATGFLGRQLMPILERKYGKGKVLGVSSQDYDLTDPVQVKRMLAEVKPEALIHLAAYSGGIGANKKFPADFYYRNTLITTLVFQEAAVHRVKKLIYPLGGCSYPAEAISPINESQMWQGFPQVESAGYATAKKMGLVASQAYRQQYGLNSVVLIPGNMYGEYDNFHPQYSHVVPAMIRRYHEAKLARVKTILMWGDGAPVRDFVYAGDVARLIPWFLENYDETGPVNISTGTATQIKDLAEIIKDFIGFAGEIRWDASKPNGQMIKVFDVTRLKSLGLSCDTPLKEGLLRTIKWFSEKYGSKEVRL